MANFYDILVEVLKVEKRFFTEDGALLRNKVYESALNMEAGLIELLLSNAETKKRFFVDVNVTCPQSSTIRNVSNFRPALLHTPLG